MRNKVSFLDNLTPTLSGSEILWNCFMNCENEFCKKTLFRACYSLLDYSKQEGKWSRKVREHEIWIFAFHIILVNNCFWTYQRLNGLEETENKNCLQCRKGLIKEECVKTENSYSNPKRVDLLEHFERENTSQNNAYGLKWPKISILLFFILE